MKNLRTKLKKCESRIVELELYPKMYFREDEQPIENEPPEEQMIFKYAFIVNLRDEAIGARIKGYNRFTIYKKTLKILENNKSLIEEFLQEYTNKHKLEII